MNKFKGTPAPWRVDRNDTTAIISGGKWTGFCAIILKPDGWEDDHKHGIANANLISAAPDLLEALQLALSTPRNEWDGDKQKICLDAIAKALGE